jgi:hypothetical protein
MYFPEENKMRLTAPFIDPSARDFFSESPMRKPRLISCRFSRECVAARNVPWLLAIRTIYYAIVS